jgi:hypothetical protein
VPDFTTEITEITETDRKERRVRIRNPFFPASVASVPSVVRLRISPPVVKSQEKCGWHVGSGGRGERRVIVLES